MSLNAISFTHWNAQWTLSQPASSRTAKHITCTSVFKNGRSFARISDALRNARAMRGVSGRAKIGPVHFEAWLDLFALLGIELNIVIKKQSR
jgi:hypothetical protein